MKQISSQSTIYELCSKYPELIPILDELGFHEISNPLMRATAGKFMTLPKGAAAKSIPWDTIIRVLHNRDFEIIA